MAENPCSPGISKFFSATLSFGISSATVNGGGEEIGLAVSPPQKVTFIKPVVHQVIPKSCNALGGNSLEWAEKNNKNMHHLDSQKIYTVSYL